MRDDGRQQIGDKSDDILPTPKDFFDPPKTGIVIIEEVANTKSRNKGSPLLPTLRRFLPHLRRVLFCAYPTAARAFDSTGIPAELKPAI